MTAPLVLDHVSYAYPGGAPVLHDVSLAVAEGRALGSSASPDRARAPSCACCSASRGRRRVRFCSTALRSTLAIAR